jgi:hypothetical protein
MPLQAAAILAIINGLVGAAMSIWSSARKILGEDQIPSWEEILQKNIDLQAKIDAQK